MAYLSQNWSLSSRMRIFSERILKGILPFYSSYYVRIWDEGETDILPSIAHSLMHYTAGGCQMTIVGCWNPTILLH
jgi:hypothetical protein